jgi:hypothetical protein
MEIVDVIAKRDFYDARVGDIMRKQRLKIPRVVAEQLETIRLVTIVPVPLKAVPKIPVLLKPLRSGQVEPSALFAADLPSPSKTARRSRGGSRKKAGESSQ